MEDRARELLRRVGVHEDLSDDDFRDILAASTASTGSAGSDISVPAALLGDIVASPAFRDTRQRRSSGAAEAPAPPPARAALGDAPDARKLQAYESRIEALEEQLSVATHEKRLLELETSRRIRSLQEALETTRSEATAAVTAARTAQVTAEAGLTAAREKLEAAKAGFSDLVVSAALYEELSRQPSDALSLRQYVQLKVHETLLPLKGDLEAARREADAAKAEAAAQLASFERNTRDLQHRTALAEGRETALREEVRLKESMVARLQTSLNAALAQVEALHGKGAAFDTTEARRRELEVLREKDAGLLAAATAAAEVAKADKEAAVSEARALRAKAEALAADKATLASQLDDARAAGRRLTDQLTLVEDSRRDAVRQRDAYHEQLLRLQVDVRTAAEERVETEVRRLRESAALELDTLRVATTEGYEREVKALREDRASLTAAVERLTQRVEALQGALDAARSTAAVEAAESARVTAELRGVLKTKAYELERTSLAAAEATEGLRKRGAEADSLRERLAALQVSYDRQGLEAERQISALQAALAGERERLAMYDRLETEMDDAVLLAAYEKPELAATTAVAAPVEAPSEPPTAAVPAPVPAATAAALSTSYDSESQGYSDDEFAAASDAEDGNAATTASAPKAAAVAAPAAPRAAPAETVTAAATARDTLRASATAPAQAVTSLADALAVGVPTTARRRLRQCMALAKELLAAQNEIAALQQRYAELRGRLDAAVAEGEEARRQLELVSGPHAYLVAALRAREADLKAARTDAGEARAELVTARTVLADVQAARDAAQRELRRVLAARSDVQALAELVQAALAARPAIELGASAAFAAVPASTSAVGPASEPALDPFFARYLKDAHDGARPRGHAAARSSSSASGAHHEQHGLAHHTYGAPLSDNNSVASMPLSAGDLLGSGGDGASTPSSAGPTRETPLKGHLASHAAMLSPPARSSLTVAAAGESSSSVAPGGAALQPPLFASEGGRQLQMHYTGLHAGAASGGAGGGHGWGSYAAESPAASGLLLLPDSLPSYGGGLSGATQAVTAAAENEAAAATVPSSKPAATQLQLQQPPAPAVRTVYAVAPLGAALQGSGAQLAASGGAGRWHSRTVLL